MLSGVLLHVIAAAGSVDLTMDFRSSPELFWRSFEVVDDASVCGISDLGDFEIFVFCGNDTGVEDLAAAGWVEGGAVEEKSWLGIRLKFTYFGFEVVEERVVVVEALGHG